MCLHIYLAGGGARALAGRDQAARCDIRPMVGGKGDVVGGNDGWGEGVVWEGVERAGEGEGGGRRGGRGSRSWFGAGSPGMGRRGRQGWKMGDDGDEDRMRCGGGGGGEEPEG